jgi:hypothetical protein
MALVKRWIYPPDWDETNPGDGEDISNVSYGRRRYILHIQKYWGATEDFTKLPIVDISGMVGVSNKEVLRTVVEKVEYQIFGINVRLYWQTTPADVEICSIGSTGVGVDGTITGPLLDPRTGDGTDGSGDLLLSTVDGASKDSMDLKIYLKVKETEKPDVNR